MIEIIEEIECENYEEFYNKHKSILGDMFIIERNLETDFKEFCNYFYENGGFK